MIDVNQITTTLRGMPDRALQQYAMMNKANPYILSLAVAESNQRKQLRSAAQARMAAPQPKVADSAIASMAEAPAVDAMGNVTGMAAGGLPEDQGIGRLPTPNIQRMADGGIAGYGDDANEGMAAGGSMFDFAQRSEPVLRMAGGGEVKRYAGKSESLVRTTNGGKTWFLDIPKTIRDPSVPYYREIPNPAAALADMEFPSKDAALQAAATASTKYQSSPTRQPYSLELGSTLPTVNNMYVTPEGKGFIRNAELTDKEHSNEKKNDGLRQNQYPTFAGSDAPIVPRWSESVATAPSAASAAPAVASTATVPAPAAASANVPSSPVVPNAPPAPAASAAPRTQGTQGGSSGLGIQGMYDLFAGPKNVRDTELNEIQQRIREQGEAETSAAQRQLDQLKSDITAQGEYGKDKETKLKAKGERIAKEEGQAGGLALLEAGLAIMSGTSANAFENIGKGSMAGTAAYRKSMDKLEDAKDKLDDAYGRLEDARFNQKNMNNAEIRKATADVDKAANAGLKYLTDFAVTRYGMKREDAKTMFTGAMQERIANIGAGATLEAARMRSKDQSEYLNAVRGSGAIETARKNLREQIMKANKYGTPEEIEAEFNKQWPQVLQMNPALAQLAGSTGGGAAVDTTGFRVLR